MSEQENKLVTNDQLFDSLIGKQFNKTYQIEEKIGVGGMGGVFRATNLESKETVAIKVIFPELASNTTFIKRFEREAKVCWMLSHPNIVKVYEFGSTENNMLFMVMEYVEGTALDDYLEGRLPLSPSQCLEIIKPLCGALEMAHRHSILHRDIKPANVLVGKNEQGFIVKLVDFGVAKLLEEGIDFSNAGSLTVVGQTFGTPHYMAPELLKEDSIELGPTIDLYSLGTIVYEMLSGELPFNTMNITDLLALKLKNTEIELSKRYSFIPSDFDYVIKKVLAYDQKNRYQSAEDFLKDFENVVNKCLENNPVENQEDINKQDASKNVQQEKVNIIPVVQVPHSEPLAIASYAATASVASSNLPEQVNNHKDIVDKNSEKDEKKLENFLTLVIVLLVLVGFLVIVMLKKSS
jgi:serine/threonine-protein kinase